VKPYWVYIAICSDGSLYTGIAVDVRKRIDTHNAGRGSKYTRSRLPIRIGFVEEAQGRSRALKRENEIKRMSRRAKLLLCRGFATVPRNS